ncbi:MAG TPA: acyloxyacyl hydrolase [Burkholderiales bacterium]|nr:acyloxyacyl hydrolase [Burkholderiales bacterium]
MGGPGENAAMVEVGWFREFGFPGWSFGDWKLRGNLSLDAGYWHAYGRESSHDTKEVGVTPVFRLEPTGTGPLYLEGGVGVHLISHTLINAERRFSTSLQFGDLLGFGLRLGEHLQYEVGLRIVHFSNAGIKEPNSGINFVALQLAYRFAPKAVP